MSAIAIDTSAIVELLVEGAHAQDIRAKLDAAELVQVTALARVEAAFVLMGRFAWRRSTFDRAWQALGLAEVAVDSKIASLAIDAFEAWGKERHKAGLNFGDCFSYALALDQRAPLLFVGDDFSQTDIPPV
jgi:ribonuclease VapC